MPYVAAVVVSPSYFWGVQPPDAFQALDYYEL